MDAAQLAQVEVLAATLFETTNEAARQDAQARLLSLQTTPDNVPNCQYILEHSKNHYAIFVASKSLTALIAQHW